MLNNTPPEIDEIVRELAGGDEVLFTTESDMATDGALGSQWLIVTSKELIAFSKNGTGPDVHHRIAIKDIDHCQAEAMVGSGCIVANIKGEFVPIIRYTNALSREFGRAARIVKAANENEEAPPETEEDRAKRCENCGLPVDQISGVCAYCVNKGQAIKRLLVFMVPYRQLLITAAACTLASQALNLAPPYLTKILIDDVLGKAERLGVRVTDSVQTEMIAQLGMVVLALVGAKLVSVALEIVGVRINARLGSRVVHDIRMKLYTELQRLTVGFYDKRQSGAVISRISQDTNSLQRFLAHDVQFMASNALILVMVIAVMFIMNWKLAAFTIIPTPFVMVVVYFIFKKIRWMHGRVWRRWSKLHGAMSDAIQGLRVVKAFAQENREVARFEERSRDLYLASRKAEETWGTLLPIMWLFLTSGQFIVWYIGGLDVINGLDITTGTLVAFIGYTGMIYGPLQIVTRLWDWLSRCLAASERIFEYMDAQKEEDEREDKITLENIAGHVKFDNVTFGYDKNRPVLHNIDLEVMPGEMIGLVGHSGAGKSTIINLLTRFYIAQEGNIEIDGADVRKIRLEDLRRQIGIVPQEPYLFSGTIAENISYSKPEATNQEIMQAAKIANAHDFIMGFPDGYETHVGERGLSLSGGERQRIAIARAILDDPKILILDEATSSVDSETERQIQQALNRLVKNRTTFAIAHRLSTLKNADRLLVLQKGRRVELGTHMELMKKNGIYARLVTAQREQSSMLGVGG